MGVVLPATTLPGVSDELVFQGGFLLSVDEVPLEKLHHNGDLSLVRAQHPVGPFLVLHGLQEEGQLCESGAGVDLSEMWGGNEMCNVLLRV